MAKQPTFRDGEYQIIQGVKYKSGSAKIIEQDDKYYVEYNRRLWKMIVIEHKIYPFPTLPEAEIKYNELKTKLYHISRS